MTKPKLKLNLHKLKSIKLLQKHLTANKNFLFFSATILVSTLFFVFIWPTTTKYFYEVSFYQDLKSYFHNDLPQRKALVLSILIIGLIIIFYNSIFKYIISPIRKRVKLNHFIWIYLVVYTVFFTLIAYHKHTNLRTAIFDLAVEEQVIYNIANGDWMGSGVEDPDYTTLHFAPMLAIPAIIYKVFPYTLTLFIIQSLCVAIAALGVYYMGRHIIKSPKLAFIWMIGFTWMFGIAGPLTFDFHEIMLALPLLIWGIYFFITNKNIILTYALFIAAALCKEDVNLFIAVLGLYWVVFEKSKRAIPIFLLGGFMSYLTMFVIIPGARGGQSSRLLLRYSDWGDTSGEIVKNIITHPKWLFDYIRPEWKLSYMYKLFLPVGFFFIFAPLAALIFIPSLLLNLLNKGELGTTGTAHYEILIIVGLIYASMLGYRNFLTFMQKYYERRDVLKSTGLILFLFSILFMVGSPMWAAYNVPDRKADYEYIQGLKKRIPKDAIVSAANLVGGQFGDRPRSKLQIYDPAWVGYSVKPDYVIIDKLDNYTPALQKRVASEVTLQGGYTAMEENESFIVLKKN